MDRKVRFAQLGVGRMGSMHIKYACMKGCELVAAFDISEQRIGKDAGEVAGIEDKGILISDIRDLEVVLKDTKPDIVMVATKSFIKDVKDDIIRCITCGANVITICEEALWPWETDYESTHEIDEAAKKYGVAVLGTGFADVYWGNLPAMMIGGSGFISKIHGTCIVNLQDYGYVLAERHGVGLSEEAFKEKFGTGKSTDTGAKLKDTCFLGDQNGWICNYMGLHIQSQKIQDIPFLAKDNIYSKAMDITIPAGNVIGASTVVRTETEEGITIIFEIGGKVYEDGDIDSTQWTIEGDPSTKIIIDRPPTPQLTCTISVNRIPDVINASPGYITTDMLPFNVYRRLPMNRYVD
jgi:hypothetical protein